MWTVISINNENHSAVLRHTDGETMAVVVPMSARRTAADKMAWLETQTDARDKVKAKLAKKWKRPYVLYAIMLAEAAAILLLLLRH